jgi:hypothetical protein
MPGAAEPQRHGSAPVAAISSSVSNGSWAATLAPAACSPLISGSALE